VYATDPPLVVIDELAHLLPSCASGDAARWRIVRDEVVSAWRSCSV
jgi:hypothetical protein